MRVSEIFPSKYIKFADLGGKPVTRVITHADEQEVGQNREVRPVLYFEGTQQGMVLNQRNARLLAERFGDDLEGWAGRSVELFPMVVDFGGRPTNTIRLRLPTGKPVTFGEDQ